MTAPERILDFTLSPARLSLRYGQLVIERSGFPETTAPMDELAVVILAQRQLTITQPALNALMLANAVILVCDETLHPSGMMLPLAGHHQQTTRMLAQAAAAKPLKKRIWQQLVTAKVRSQGRLLDEVLHDDAGLYAMADTVRSGDTMNIEGQAAQRYWPLLFNDAMFRRRRDAEDQNKLLNYGYAVLRAAVARSVCAVGLHPSLGVQHHSRSNAYCLVDDIMEPYRPLVDAVVRDLVGQYGKELPLAGFAKERLIQSLHSPLQSLGERRTALAWIERTCSSVAQMLQKQTTDVFIPGGLIGK